MLRRRISDRIDKFKIDETNRIQESAFSSLSSRVFVSKPAREDFGVLALTELTVNFVIDEKKAKAISSSEDHYRAADNFLNMWLESVESKNLRAWLTRKMKKDLLKKIVGELKRTDCGTLYRLAQK